MTTHIVVSGLAFDRGPGLASWCLALAILRLAICYKDIKCAIEQWRLTGAASSSNWNVYKHLNRLVA